jgi:hypothetical protein
VNGQPEYSIDHEHVLELLVNDPEFVFGRIYRVRNRTYREVGILTAYKQKADAETHAAHWRAEGYITPKSYSDKLLEGLGRQLLAVTACVEPLMVNVCFGDRTEGRYKTYGQVWLDEDE